MIRKELAKQVKVRDQAKLKEIQDEKDYHKM
jgi:hypothetical protein